MSISIQINQDANTMPESQKVVNEAFNEHLRKANKTNSSNYVIPYYWKGSDAPSVEKEDIFTVDNDGRRTGYGNLTNTTLTFLYDLAFQQKFSDLFLSQYLVVARNLFGDDFMCDIQFLIARPDEMCNAKIRKIFGCWMGLIFIEYHFERSETIGGKKMALFSEYSYQDFSMHQHSKLSATRLRRIGIIIKGDDKKKWTLTQGTLIVRRLHPEVQKLIKLCFVPGGTLHVGMQQLLTPYLALISSKEDFKYMCDERIFDSTIWSYDDIVGMTIAPHITVSNSVAVIIKSLYFLDFLATQYYFIELSFSEYRIVAETLFGDDITCDFHQLSAWRHVDERIVERLFGGGMALIFIDYHFERFETTGVNDNMLIDEDFYQDFSMHQHSKLSATMLRRIGIIIKGDDKKKWTLTQGTLIVRRLHPEVQKLIKHCFVPGGTLHVGMQQLLTPYLALISSKEDFKYMCDERIFDSTIWSYDDIVGMTIAPHITVNDLVAVILNSLYFLHILATEKKFSDFPLFQYPLIANNLFGDDITCDIQVSAWSNEVERDFAVDKLFGCGMALLFIDYHFERSETFDDKDNVLFDKDHYHDFSMHQYSNLSATRLRRIGITIKGDNKKRWTLTRGALIVRRLHPEVQKLIKHCFVPGGTLHVGMQQLLIPYLALISSKEDFKYMCNERIFDPTIWTYDDIADMAIAPRNALNDHVAEILKSLSNAIEQYDRANVEMRERTLLFISISIGILTLVTLGSSFWSAFATQSQASAAWYAIQHPTSS